MTGGESNVITLVVLKVGDCGTVSWIGCCRCTGAMMSAGPWAIDVR